MWHSFWPQAALNEICFDFAPLFDLNISASFAIDSVIPHFQLQDTLFMICPHLLFSHSPILEG